MQTHLFSEEELDRFNELLTVDMTDFNCGELCAPDNGGKPRCCDSCHVIPLVYRDELTIDKARSEKAGLKPVWREVPPEEVVEMELPLTLNSRIERYATCNYAPACPRERRALICRTYPFIPYYDENEQLVGLTYNFLDEGKCPLVGRTDITYNEAYIRNALVVWSELVARNPEERELYIYESKELRKRFVEGGDTLPVFLP